MIEMIWFKKNILSVLLWPFLWPLSRIFKLISERRCNDYKNGKKESYRAPVPIVVIGNITAGGNGKTPVVIWLVETLQAQGYKVGVVSRGYGGNADYPFHVKQTSIPQQSGDEPLLIKRRTNACVVVDPDRSQAVRKVLDINPEIDVIITDDGLQHYALQRDVEIVVIDGQRRFGNQQFIPYGPLREGLDRLSNVDFLITNGTNPDNEQQTDQAEIIMSLKPDLAVNLTTGERKAVSELNNLIAMAGIGHPPRFFKTLEDLGAKLIKTQAFSDHQSFKADQLHQLSKRGDHLIMTEKDAVKCNLYADNQLINRKNNWWYLPVSVQIDTDDEKRIIEKITSLLLVKKAEHIK